jgi:hypothetical protein
MLFFRLCLIKLDAKDKQNTVLYASFINRLSQRQEFQKHALLIVRCITTFKYIINHKPRVNQKHEELKAHTT